MTFTPTKQMPDRQIERWYQKTYQFVYDQALGGLEWLDLVAAVKHQNSRIARSSYIYASILPILTCKAAGGNEALAIPLASSWVLYDLASDIFDDIEDNDSKDVPWNNWEPARAMNVGLGILAAAQVCLAQIQAEPGAFNEIQNEIARTFLMAARGQGLSERNPLLPWYFEHTLAKSGLVFAAVAWAGTRTNTANTRLLKTMLDFGMALGSLIQIADDCYDLAPKQVQSDLSTGVRTLPMIYGLTQKEHPRHTRLYFLLSDGHSLAQEEIEEVNQILIDMGALSYSISLAKVYEQKALAALEACCSDDSAYLRNYVCQLIPTYHSS